ARAVPESSRGEDEDLRFHRRLVQSAPAPLCAWAEVADPVRTPARARGVTAGGRVIHTLLLRAIPKGSPQQRMDNSHAYLESRSPSTERGQLHTFQCARRVLLRTYGLFGPRSRSLPAEGHRLFSSRRRLTTTRRRVPRPAAWNRCCIRRSSEVFPRDG